MWSRIKNILLLISLMANTAWSDIGWEEYKNRFVANDGRVIDRQNSDVTHSEGVGYTLALAVKYKDLSTFKSVARWMRDNLKTNDAGLSGWLWGKDKDGQWRQLEMNNATDGDLWIAYAFLKAYEWTKHEKYKEFALNRISAIKKHLSYKLGDRTFILPGLDGFSSKERLLLNPSYLLLHIYEAFSHYDDSSFWKSIYKDAVWLLKVSRYGPLKLHPNWIYLYFDNKVEPAKDMRFGYDAIRTPLNILASSIDIDEKRYLLSGYKRLVKMAVTADLMLGTVDLKNGVISYYDHSLIFHTAYQRIAEFFSIKDFNFKLDKEDEKDYYGFSVDLLYRG